MTTTTNWTLNADVLAEYSAEDGTQFQQVIETVHWRLTATDDASGESVGIYGSQSVPKPTDATTYIDLSVLQNMTDEEKRTTILGWAEVVEPGFVADKEASVAQKLQAKLDEPVRQSVSIM
jgi:hypothetical protein